MKMTEPSASWLNRLGFWQQQLRYYCPFRYDGWPCWGDPSMLEADGYSDIIILSYAAKYASAFYGPLEMLLEQAEIRR